MIPVSVIIPFFNGSKYIEETLNSVFSQSILPAEIILINDGSCKEETLFLERYKNKVTLVHQKNKGVSATRNIAISQAKHEWIAFLDQDDLWEKNKLEKQWDYIQRNANCHALHSAVKTIKDSKIIAKYKKRELNTVDFLKAHPNPSYLSSTIIKKNIIIESGLFNPILPYSQDRECFIRCSLTATFHYIDSYLTIRRQHDTNLSGNYFGVWAENIKINRFYENKFQSKNDYKKSLEALHKTYFIKAIYYRNYRMLKVIFKELSIDKISRLKFLAKIFRYFAKKS